MILISTYNIPGNVKNSYFHYIGMTEADITGFVQVSFSIRIVWLCYRQMEKTKCSIDKIHKLVIQGVGPHPKSSKYKKVNLG